MEPFQRSTTPEPPTNCQLLSSPLTPGAPLPKTFIPPSPGCPILESLATQKSGAKIRATPPPGKRAQAAGVQKTSSVPKPKTSIAKNIGAIANGKKITSLLDLPGEIRNLVYSYTAGNSRQALLVHRPRIASLRPRTRLDRHRTLKSDLLETKHDSAIPDATMRSHNGTTRHPRKSTTLLARETNRPFFGLTQVCRLLRAEFRPMYMQSQEIGMDLVEVGTYLRTFYPEAAKQLNTLSMSTNRKIDLPFTGNLTIAVGDKVKSIEKSVEGIDVAALLDIWSNSFKIEAGFGRYMQALYDATADGEAKDLYRLFGRQVQIDRRCSPMNPLWRTILRTRALAAVHIHRQPAGSVPGFPASLTGATLVSANHPPATAGPRPFIHVVFKRERAESWMTEFESQIPQNWLSDRGFDAMEYFEVKVGVEPTAGN